MIFRRVKARAAGRFTLVTLIALLPLASAFPAFAEGTWTSQTLGLPPARFLHAMAYIGGDQVLLFGGSDGDSYFDDTWLATGFLSSGSTVYLPLVLK